MKTSGQSIHVLSQSLWDRTEIKWKMDRLIWKAAHQEDMVFEKEPLENRIAVDPARIHADLNRIVMGEEIKFPETRPVLERISEEWKGIDFTPLRCCRRVDSDDLGIVGEVDVIGEIQGEPVIVEVKCVRFLPQIVRSSEAAQLILYSLAKNGRADDALLLALYIQPYPPFRAAIRPVLNPHELEPLVRQLAA